MTNPSPSVLFDLGKGDLPRSRVIFFPYLHMFLIEEHAINEHNLPMKVTKHFIEVFRCTEQALQTPLRKISTD